MNVLGTDVSFYEDNPDTPKNIDYEKMKSAGCGFTIIRAGQHIWPDVDYQKNFNLSKLAGLPRGSYWFYDSRSSPKSQADLWKQVVGNDSGELPLFADYEENYKGSYAGGENFKQFLEEVKVNFPGKEIIIYTGYWYWRDNVSTSLHAYFSQYGLWIANYGVSAPSIPLPWTKWTFWQYAESGSGSIYGTEGNVDLNWFNGDQDAFKRRFNITDSEVPPVIDETPIETHKGVTLHLINRFGANCALHVIDTKKATVKISGGGFITVSEAVKKYSAQIALNGGGWPDKQTPGHRANEAWVSDGVILQATAIDNRGFIEVARDGRVTIHEKADNPAGAWQAWGIDRVLGKDGKFNPLISDHYTKDARTGCGVTADGRLLLLSVEGNDKYQIGHTFREMWETLKEFGAVIAGNNDGGSSTAVVNTAVAPMSLVLPSDAQGEARVINQVLIFTDGAVNPPEGEAMQYEVKVQVKPRKTPSMYEANTKANLAVGLEFDSSVNKVYGITGDANSGVTFVQMSDGYWVPLIYKGVEYVKDNGAVVVPPPITSKYIKAIFIDEKGNEEIWEPVK